MTVTAAMARRRSIAGSAPSLAACRRAMVPSIVAGRRRRVTWLVAWVVGAIAGIAPTAFQGYAAPGLLASAGWGAVGVALLAPLVITPFVAVVVCDDDHHQVAHAWLALGVNPRRRLVARTTAAAQVSLRLLPVGAVAGLVAGLGLAASGRDPLRWGWPGGPTLPTVVLAGALVGLAWVIGGLIAAAAVVPSRAAVVLIASWLVTGVVASLVHFSPDLGGLFRLTPWAALWPFDPQVSDSAQFAASIPVTARLVAGASWLGLLAATAGWRRRTTPYPIPGDRRRRR